MAEISENRKVFLLGKTALTLTGLLALSLLIRLIFVRVYDYDEIQHAHLAWLVSVGQVPYRDFADNHFPFLWILVAPLMRILPESLALMVLRGLALLFNAVFIGALGTLICLELQPRQRIWAVACFGLVVFSPPVMHYLIEFRPDPLGNALLFSALVWLRLSGSKSMVSAFICGFSMGSAVLINTKCVLFLFVLGVVSLVMYAPSVQRIWHFGLTICLGFIFAVLSGSLLLGLMHIPLAGTYQMVLAYNAVVEKTRTCGFGLAHAVMQHPIWLAYSLVGLIGCAILFVHQRRSIGFFPVAILCFLVMALVTTTRPWKQYYVPWLLLAAYFPARSLPLLITRFGLPAQIALACCVLTAAVIGFSQIGITDPSGMGWHRTAQDRMIVWTSQHVPPDGFVVASFHLHPVFRRDTFFKTVIDRMADGNDGFEQFMPDLVQHSYAEYFQPSGYEKELEAHPPALIVLQQGVYTLAQAQVLSTWLTSSSNLYEQYEIPGTPVLVLKRKTYHQTLEEKQSGR